MLPSAQNEIGQASAKAFAFVREVTGEPCDIASRKLLHRHLSVGSADSKNTAWLEAAMDFAKVKLEQRIGQMLDNVVGIERINGIIPERKWVSQVGPNIALRGNKIGVYVDPAFEIIRLAGPKMGLHDPSSRCATDAV
jgi:hypothetical protein